MSDLEPQTTTPADRPAVGMFSFLTPDPQRLARFWSELMQLPTAAGASDDLVMLDLDHEVSSATWIFERSTGATSGTAPVALDIGSTAAEGWTAVAERAEELGAVRVADRDEDGVRWVEMRDPDGNRFRVFAPRPVA